MDAIFNQPENEDCWEILHFIRQREIIPVMCEGLYREYIFVPTKIIFGELATKFKLKTLTADDFKILEQASYECSSTLAKIFSDNSKVFNVVSNHKLSEDNDDNKIINLAYDANCAIIITKNIIHFNCIEEKHFKTKKGKDIKVYTPEQFASSLKLIKHSKEDNFHKKVVKFKR